MPTIEVPLRQYTEIKPLRTNKRFIGYADRLVEITAEMKRLKGEADELRLELFDLIKPALGPGEKSIAFNGYSLSPIQAKPKQSLDKKKLLSYITVDKLKKCYKLGATPRPTVSVRPIGESGEDGDEGEE